MTSNDYSPLKVPLRGLSLIHIYRALKDEYEKSNIDNEDRSRELSFLEYEVKEIEEASLVPGEDEAVSYTHLDVYKRQR